MESGASRLRGIARLLRPYAAGERKRLAAGALVGVAMVLLHVVRPWPLKWLLDLLTTRHMKSPVVSWATEAGIAGFVALSAAFVALSLLYAVAEYAQRMLLNGVSNRATYRLRTALFERLLGKSLPFHESHESGELLTRVVYDTMRLRRGVAGILMHLFQTLFLFLATLAVLLWVAPLLAALITVGGAAAMALMHRRGSGIATMTRRQRRKEGRVAALASDELQSVREVQMFGHGSSAAAARFRRKSERSLGSEQQVSRLAAALSMHVEIIFAGTVAATLALGAYLVTRERLSAGDLVLFVSYALALREPFNQFGKQTSRLGRTAACAERLGKLLEDAESPAEPSSPAPPIRGAVRIDALSMKTPKKTRSSRKLALDDVTVAIAPGERVAIVGPNGSGKSTLMRTVLGLAVPDNGRVTIDGTDIRELDPASLRAQISVIFQDSTLFGLTIRENILIGRPGASEAEITAAAEAAHVSRFIAALPAGYDTPVRRRGALLSTGERQRIAIARALLRNGRMWLLDEPTAGLDGKTSEAITEMLFERTRGRTTLWMTHDPLVLPRLDRVVALRNGRVVFAGTVDEHELWSRPQLGTGLTPSPQLQEG